VKKIAIGSEKERIIYSVGAMSGSIIAYYFGKLLI
jgi:hypothetical protein